MPRRREGDACSGGLWWGRIPNSRPNWCGRWWSLRLSLSARPRPARSPWLSIVYYAPPPQCSLSSLKSTAAASEHFALIVRHSSELALPRPMASLKMLAVLVVALVLLTRSAEAIEASTTSMDFPGIGNTTVLEPNNLTAIFAEASSIPEVTDKETKASTASMNYSAPGNSTGPEESKTSAVFATIPLGEQTFDNSLSSVDLTRASPLAEATPPPPAVNESAPATQGEFDMTEYSEDSYATQEFQPETSSDEPGHLVYDPQVSTYSGDLFGTGDILYDGPSDTSADVPYQTVSYSSAGPDFPVPGQDSFAEQFQSDNPLDTDQFSDSLTMDPDSGRSQREEIYASFARKSKNAKARAKTYRPKQQYSRPRPSTSGVAWRPARATFYGSIDASGTMGGACGFGNLYATGYGVDTAALSTVLFKNGLSCGACYEVKCVNSPACYGNSITVTATNFCPPGSSGGYCDVPNEHFDLSQPVFSRMAKVVAGVVPLQYRRVACVKKGGIRYTINGNCNYLLVTIFNVGRSGVVTAAFVKGDNSNSWSPMKRSWGVNFFSGLNICGQGLSFKIVTSDNRVVVSRVSDASWSFGRTYEGSQVY